MMRLGARRPFLPGSNITTGLRYRGTQLKSAREMLYSFKLPVLSQIFKFRVTSLRVPGSLRASPTQNCPKYRAAAAAFTVAPALCQSVAP
jgi:hypothetical protein